MSIEDAISSFGDYIHDHKLTEMYSKDDILKILENTNVTLDQAIILLNDCRQKFKCCEIFEVFQHLNILVEPQMPVINRFLISLTKTLECPFFTALSSVLQILITQSAFPTKNQVQQPHEYNFRRSLSTDIYSRFGSELFNSSSRIALENENVHGLETSKKDFEKCYKILVKSAQDEDDTCIQYAIEKGYIDIKGKYERNIFLEAAYKGEVKLVKSLAENGYDVTIHDKNNRSGLLWAAYGGHIHCVRYLIGLDHTSNANQALIYACASGHLKIVQFLTSLKNVDVSAVDADGMTALHWASISGHIDVVKYLCTIKGININEKDNNGRTAVHCASCKGHLTVVQYLCSLPNMNIADKDNDGRTALHIAARDGFLQIVHYLVTQKGIKVNDLSNAWLTPLDYAKNDDIKKFLKSQMSHFKE